MKIQPDHFVTEILLKRAEIQEIFYKTDEYRSTTSILCLHSLCFQHVMFLKINLQGKLMTLTSRKFFGSYYHSLIKHAPEQYRLFSGRTSDTEKEEATFKSIKMFTNLSSNHHPNNVLINTLIRLRYRESLHNTQLKQDSRSTNLYSEIKKCLNETLFSFQWMGKYKRQYEYFLRSIADYLVDEGTWWRETTEGVEFCDIGEAPENTSMIVSHFRSTTIKQQPTHVSNCWAQAMMEKNTKIPAQSIENINTKNRELLTTLKYFSDITTPPDVMQSTFEFENASTNISNTSDTSMISQSTIPVSSRLP